MSEREPFEQQSDNTRTSGPKQSAAAAEAGVPGGGPGRIDSPGPGSGGLACGGADGETGAREQLRKDLGERDASLGSEEGASLEQGAAVGETDDPQGGSIQEHGARP